MYKPEYKQLGDKEWLLEKVKTLTLREIAKEVGCNYSTVQRATVVLGIRIPKKRLKPHPQMSEIAKAAYRKKWPNGRFGALASRWKGGRRGGGSRREYIIIYSPEHPNATQEGYVMEHRLVMEKHIGRYLTLREQVHHKNGNKKDNRIENLELMESRSAHAQKHVAETAELVRLKQLLEKHGIEYSEQE